MARNIAMVLLILGLVVFALLYFADRQKIQETETMLHLSREQLIFSENKLGEQVASKSVLYGNYLSLKAVDAGKDSLLKLLQEQVNSKTVSATVFASSTRHDTILKSNVVFPDTPFPDSLFSDLPDSVKMSEDSCKAFSQWFYRKLTDSSLYIFPTYSTDTVRTQWEEFAITASRSGINLHHISYNIFQVEQSYHKKGLFSKKEIELHITSKNPNTKTIDGESYHAEIKSGSGFYFTAGGILGLVGGFLLFK